MDGASAAGGLKMETEMTEPYFFDPLQLWRDAVSKLEKSANEHANAQLKSPGVARSLQDAATVSFGLQQAYAKATDAYLRQANLPSRNQVLELAETLQRIEEKLDRLLPAAAVPRPARTRRPAAAMTPPAPTPMAAPAKEAVPRKATTAKGTAARSTKTRPARGAKGRRG
jgi:hypothetical protein